MERYQDITELLEAVESNIKNLKKSYDKAKKDEEQKEVLRPIVKSSLEHLRSILEYSVQDIWFSYNSNSKKRLYFPYGIRESLFKEQIDKNLPELAKRRPNLYALIESLQPHKCGDNWLIELCDQTNFNKHNKLSSQIRKNSERSTTIIGGGAIRIDGNGDGGTVTFIDCNVNGIQVGHGKPAVISDDMSAKKIQEIIGAPISVTKEFEWVEFRFENSTIDTLMLIKKAYTEISKYISLLNTGLS